MTSNPHRWCELAEQAIRRGGITGEQLLEALAAPQLEVHALLDAARRVRMHHHGNRVRLHILLNAKSGACPEDCAFCSQSGHHQGAIETYPMVDAAAIVQSARNAHQAGAHKFCIATASRSLSDRELELLCTAVREIRQTLPIRVCTSLGFLDEERARRLAEAGVQRYNHNLETSSRLFPRICTTHTWDDRLRTLRHAREAGLELCCGFIVGLGESNEDLVELAFALRGLDVASIPVNFLNPRPNTPLAHSTPPSPLRCLQVLAAFRLAHPRVDLRAAGGRELALKNLQPLALLAVDSIFTRGYLTTPGSEPSADRRMIEELGFVVEPCGDAGLQL